MADDDEQTDDEQAMTEADRSEVTGAETAADPEQDEVGPVSGEAEDEDGQPSSGAVSAQFEELPSEEEQARVEEERQERLDPDNRPEGAEVDNTDRDFDHEKGLFTDNDDYESAEAKFPAAGAQGA